MMISICPKNYLTIFKIFLKKKKDKHLYFNISSMSNLVPTKSKETNVTCEMNCMEKAAGIFRREGM